MLVGQDGNAERAGNDGNDDGGTSVEAHATADERTPERAELRGNWKNDLLPITSSHTDPAAWTAKDANHDTVM